MEIMTRVPAPVRRISGIGALALAAALAVPLLAMATPADAATAAAVTASATDVTSTAGTVQLGQPVSFHAFVDPADGGGTVTFTSNGVTIPGCAGLPFLSGGEADWETACTTSSLPAGSDTITATYSGDAAFAGSSGSVTENVSLPPTSTVLTASPAQVYTHAPVTLTAQVSGGDGGGSVSFYQHFLLVCDSVPLIGYTATCTVPSWPATGDSPAIADYSGDSVSGGSEGRVVVTVLGPAPTSASLSLSSPGAVYGQEQTEQASVTVSADSGGTPDGTVQVISTLSGQVLCTIGLGSGSGACTLPPTAVPAGATRLVAEYTGSNDFNPSFSDPTTLTVAQAATATALSLSPAGLAYGAEQTEQVSATVTAPDGTPDGTVTVTSGPTTVCTITLAAGTGTCSPAAAQLPAGTYQLTAAYNGSGNFTGSASAARNLTIAKAATTTALSLAPAKETYGDEQTEQVSVTVSSPGGTPDGTVTVTSGATTVCTITLAAGPGTCSPAAAQLPAGTYQFIATYNGSASFTGSASAAQTLTVARATTTTVLSLSAATVTHGQEQAEHLTVSVVPQYGGTPDGTVTVKSGTTKVCTITLASGGGSCTLGASKLPVGTYTLTATYPAGSNFTSSTSAGVALTVAA